ncbi:MAG: hypothetical protein O9296_00470 [Novosphingobium sp.]|nr:hypothetical protein [Novosphingobium sp.]
MRFLPTLALATALPLAIGIAHATDRAESTPRQAVTDLKPLLARAAAEGGARGTLTGPSAQAIARRFQTNTPIEIDVRRLQRLPQPGCGRLEVITRQRDVNQAGKRGDQEMVYQISYCADGRFPEER